MLLTQKSAFAELSTVSAMNGPTRVLVKALVATPMTIKLELSAEKGRCGQRPKVGGLPHMLFPLKPVIRKLVLEED